jgi:hypothetical protein
MITPARAPFDADTATPLLSHVALVPVHFELAARMNPAGWQPNGLAGGDFENLGHMTRNGWENQRAPMPGIATHVELATSPVVRGSSSLLMSARAEAAGVEMLVDRPPLWIRSGPVPVRAGQLVRIHGWVQATAPIAGSLEGLRIVDSIGGPEMAERIVATTGWREFSLYRCPSQDTELRVTFELAGLGDVYLDEVEIQVLNLPGAATATMAGEPETATQGR